MDKPVCKKCGIEHWGFLSCDKATEANRSEEQNALEREQEKRKSMVVPVPRTDPRWHWAARQNGLKH